jgi:hypothetical protein
MQANGFTLEIPSDLAGISFFHHRWPLSADDWEARLSRKMGKWGLYAEKCFDM